MSKRNPFINSFPVQIIFTHLRRNIGLLAVWFLLISACLGNIGDVYGIRYLFLDPEYLGRVNFWSFFIVGITFGQLTMAFHMTSYILDSHRYTFLGVVSRPFAKFSLNNSVIPTLAFVTYLVLIIRFQLQNEFRTPLMVFEDVLGFICGALSLLLVSFYYFRMTNKDLFKSVAGKLDEKLRKSSLSRGRVMKKLSDSRREQQRFVIHNYFDLRLSLQKTNKLPRTFDKEAVLKVFDQNHVNSVLIGISLIVILILLGGFIENPILQIPAAASAILFFTVIIILIGAISYWFRGWGLPFVILLFVTVNMGVKFGLTKGIHEAKGLEYSENRAEYSLDKLRAINTPQEYYEDIHHMLHTLTMWKERQTEEKPKMVLLCVSGGGQRAALWTTNALQRADSVLDGSLMKRTTLISGASGGMIGAAFYRELYLRSLKADSLHLMDEKYLNQIAKDNLNPVIFSLLVNDTFFSFRNYEYQGKTYTKDRGYAFEYSLNQNLGNVLDKTIADYTEVEKEAIIPTMLLSPTIANDGRRLYITSRPFSFMNIDESPESNRRIRGVDFLRFFEDQDAKSMSFMSALRMSASFPYITPTVSLPSKPRMEIMDAGIADNFGVSDALRFMYVFRDWIADNTSGVLMLIIRDTNPNEEIRGKPMPSITDKLTYPIASVYNNLAKIQDRNNDVRLEQAREWFPGALETVELIYDTSGPQTEQERASLSWHLTTKEKHSIISTINTSRNKKALQRLEALMK